MTSRAKPRADDRGRAARGAGVSGPEAIALLCFFLSGAAGLIYEVCWIRRAALVFGSTVHALSTVLAVFFLGLAIGSHLFGGLARRVARPLRLYALLEAALALLALASLPLFSFAEPLYGSAFRAFSGTPALLMAARVLLVALVILPPAVLMGGTLPLFCRRFVRERARIGGSVGFLYGVNTLGAATGCALAGFWLLPNLGLARSIAAGAALSLVSGAVVWALRIERAAPQPVAADPAPSDARARTAATAQPARAAWVIGALVFFAGFSALGLEVLWTRYLALLFRNTVTTYTLTLTVVLGGIVIGSVLGSRFFDGRLRHSLVFGALQVASALSVLFLMKLPPEFWRGIGGELATDALLMLPAAVLSGAAFPLAVRMVVSDPALAASGVGRIAALNTLGGIAGSLLVGFVALPSLGLERSLYLLTALGLASGFVAWFGLERPRARAGRLVAAVIAVAAAVAIPLLARTRVPDDFLARPEERVSVREGLMSNLAVVKREGVLFFEIDRLWQGQDRKTHQIMAAHLPLVLHPDPRRVLVVGAGAGQTPARVTYYPVEQLDCVDIEPAVFDVIRDHFDAAWMSDPRVTLMREDGRNFIAHTRAEYDVVSLEVGQMFRPGVGAFYTSDFYAQARARLKPGGLLSQFVPIGFLSPDAFRSVIASFLAVFPQSTLWYNTTEFLLIGANADRFTLDPRRLDLLSANPRVRDDLSFGHWGGRDLWLNQPRVFLGAYLCGPQALAELASGAARYRDDRPVLEYATTRADAVQGAELAILDLLRPRLEPVEALLPSLEALPAAERDAIPEIRRRNLGQIVSNAVLRRVETADTFEQAAAILEEALRANPDNAKANRVLGDALASRDRLDEAIPRYAHALEMRPDDPLARRGIAIALHRSGRPAEAIPHYRAALELGLDGAALRDALAQAEAEAAALPK